MSKLYSFPRIATSALQQSAHDMLRAFVDRLVTNYTSSDMVMPWLHELAVADWTTALGMKRLCPGAASPRGSVAVEYLFTPPVFTMNFCGGPNGKHLKRLLTMRGHLSETRIELVKGRRPMAVVVLAPSLFTDRFDIQPAD
jgi:hypothetical protein